MNETVINTRNKSRQEHTETTRRPVFWVVSSHWDREWYETFQSFRYRLVKVLDEVLELLETNPQFTCFQMDGQSIPIEDYLEARPERAEQIRRLAAAGRLAIGPWYVMPDEFLVSGESLVRNLQEGLRVAAQWGTPSRVGFMCDIFGHNSQLPQILRGFDIDNAFVWRGLNEAQTGSYFRWQASDGTEVIAHHMGPRVGYCDFAFNIRHAHEAEVIVDFEHLHQALDDYIQLQASRCQTPMPILLFDGGDHQQAEPRTGNVVQALANNGLAERFELRMGTLDDLAAAMRAQDASGLPVMHGELRYPGVKDGMDNDQQWVIPGVLSSRIHLKQANAQCESLLTQWAEPWSLFATTQGLEYPHGFLHIAWRQLLMNHAHDSICGCSQDQVHRDMEYRFDQARMVAERLQRAALEQLARSVAFPAAGETSAPRRLLLVANPTSRVIDEPVDLLVRLPETTPTFQEYFGYEPKPGFWLRTAGDESVPYQRVAQSSGYIEVQRRSLKFPKPVKHHQIEVTARLRIPAFGYTALAIEPSRDFTRHEGASLVTGVRRAENEFLQLEIDTQGLLNLTDKRSGQRFAGLLELEDRADIGDGWYHGTAVNDQVFYSGAVSAAVACVADGPERAEFLIEMDWTLPTRFEFDAMRRSPERTTLHVEHRVTLRAGCARVEVRTVVQNTLKDHRLRVLFPTGTQAESYLSDTPFDVVRRSLKPDPRHVTWRELEVETKPQHTWTAIHDEQRGLAVVSQGLPESAVPDLAERPIALTLFRGFKKTVFTQGEPGGQIAGQLSFNYWLVPLAGAPDVTELCYLGQRLAGGLGQQLCNWQNPADATAAMPAAQNAAPTAGFLEVSGDVVVTAVRANEAGQMVVRLFNPTEAATVCTLQRPQGFRRAWQCNLEEQPRQALELCDAAATFAVAPHRIMTLLLD